ncbi:MAG: hypothetical protein LAN61_04820 [Acidobacteriia bacterium]|nr:hypothetical protein [Terriglobia bacterium]
MGDWKAQISVRVRQALRAELEEIAAREHRKLGNLTELLIEWSSKHLKEAGCTEELLRSEIRLRDDLARLRPAIHAPKGK